MPVLGKVATEKHVLPSTSESPEPEQAWVLLNKNITLEDVAGAEKYENTADKMAYGVAKVVVEWNYTDENNNPLPIDIENCRKLNFVDAQFINEWVEKRLKVAQQGLSESEKKA